MISWSPGMKLEDLETKVIKAALHHYGSEEKAALSLNISFKEMQKKLKRYEEEQDKIQKQRQLEREREEAFVLRSRGIA